MIARPQPAVVAYSAVSSTLNLTLSPTTKGQLIVVFASSRTSLNTLTISDNKGNTYTPVPGFENVNLSNGNHSETNWIGFTVDAFGGVTTVTVANPNVDIFASVQVYDSTNGWPSNPVDKSNSAAQFGSMSLTSGATGILSQASEVVVGFTCFLVDPGTITPSGSFLLATDSTYQSGTSARQYTADEIVSSTASQTWAATLLNSCDPGNAVVSFADSVPGLVLDDDGFLPPVDIAQW